MSAEQAQAFVEKMKSDEAFRARVMAEEDVDARMALIVAA
jgi:predicted ribosomally synthesized peptide with nif11-like leader